DNRPDNRKVRIADAYCEEFWQAHHPSEPHPEQGSDKTECDRNQTATARIARYGLAGRPANPSDEKKNQYVEKSHCLWPWIFALCYASTDLFVFCCKSDLRI